MKDKPIVISSWKELPDEVMPVLESMDWIIDEEEGRASVDLAAFMYILDTCHYDRALVNIVKASFMKACEEQLIGYENKRAA